MNKQCVWSPLESSGLSPDRVQPLPAPSCNICIKRDFNAPSPTFIPVAFTGLFLTGLWKHHCFPVFIIPTLVSAQSVPCCSLYRESAGTTQIFSLTQELFLIPSKIEFISTFSLLCGKTSLTMLSIKLIIPIEVISLCWGSDISNSFLNCYIFILLRIRSVSCNIFQKPLFFYNTVFASIISPFFFLVAWICLFAFATFLNCLDFFSKYNVVIAVRFACCRWWCESFSKILPLYFCFSCVYQIFIFILVIFIAKILIGLYCQSFFLFSSLAW